MYRATLRCFKLLPRYIVVFMIFLFGILYFYGAEYCKGNRVIEKHDVEIPPAQLEELKLKWLSEQTGKLKKADEPPRIDSKQAFVVIECLINNNYTVDCLKSTEGDDAIYMPFSFLEKYYEIYAKMKHFDGYDRFEFSHSSTRVVYDPKSPYTYKSNFMTFDAYQVEIRDRVKYITGIEGVPLSIQWGLDGYFYPIQIAQYGISHYSKNVIAKKPPHQNVYEDGEKNSKQGTYKMTNHHCLVSNVYDNEQNSNVIKFVTPVSMPMGNGISLILGNTMERELTFDIKFVTNGSISVVLDTAGRTKSYTIHYVTNSAVLDFDHKSNIYFGIGPSTEWRQISRSLVADLRKGFALGNKKVFRKTKINILKVSKIILRGEGFIDNVTISTSNNMAHFNDACRWMFNNQDLATGGWKTDFERALDGFDTIPAGWLSAMAQGQAMSLLSRGYFYTKNEMYVKALSAALKPFTVPSNEGGIRAVFLDKYVWYEEYPTHPSSFVLNGFIYSLIGLYDFKSLLEDQFDVGGPINEETRERFFKIDVDILQTYALVSALFDDGLASLKAMLPLYDGGSRTFYDLRHFMLKMSPNVARWDYHATHLSQLRLLASVTNDPLFERFFDSWYGYMIGIPAKHN